MCSCSASTPSPTTSGLKDEERRFQLNYGGGDHRQEEVDTENKDHERTIFLSFTKWSTISRLEIKHFRPSEIEDFFRYI